MWEMAWSFSILISWKRWRIFFFLKWWQLICWIFSILKAHIHVWKFKNTLASSDSCYLTSSYAGVTLPYRCSLSDTTLDTMVLHSSLLVAGVNPDLFHQSVAVSSHLRCLQMWVSSLLTWHLPSRFPRKNIQWNIIF